MDGVIAGALVGGLIAVFGHQIRMSYKIGALCQEVKGIKEYLINNNKR